MARFLALFSAVCFVCVAPLAAQDQEPASRTDLLSKMREEKARVLRPYEPKGLEKILLYVDQHRLIERFTVADGWYPTYGGPITGSGFGGGAGYRKHFLHDELFVDVTGRLTTKLYKEVLAAATYPSVEGGLFEFGTEFAWRDYPQEDFFGMGSDTLPETHTNYALQMNDISVHGTVKPVGRVRFGGTLGFVSPTIDSGTDSRYRSIEELFTDADAPGLARQPNFLYKRVTGKVDYRDQIGNPRSGGLLMGSYTWFTDRDFDLYSFRQFDAEAAYFFPIFDKKRVIAVRSRMVASQSDEGQQVPFYFLPYLGGSRSVRGFEEFRFRDRNVFFVNLEYRWEAFSGLDMAVFADAGDVGPEWGDIHFGSLKKSYGVGFRFNTYKNVFFRIDIGRGGEGTQLFLKFGPAF